MFTSDPAITSDSSGETGGSPVNIGIPMSHMSGVTEVSGIQILLEGNQTHQVAVQICEVTFYSTCVSGGVTNNSGVSTYQPVTSTGSPHFQTIYLDTPWTYSGTKDVSIRIYSTAGANRVMGSIAEVNVPSTVFTYNSPSLVPKLTLFDTDGPTPDQAPPNFNQNSKHLQIIKPQYSEITTTSTKIEINFKNPQFGGDSETVLNVQVKDYKTNQIELNQNVTLSTTTADGTFLNTSNYNDGSKYLIATIKKNNQILSQATGFFHVNTNTYLQTTGTENPNQSGINQSQLQECDTFAIGCQIQKVFTFLFIPDTSFFSTLLDIESDIKTKIPISYVYGIYDIWQNLQTTDQTVPQLSVQMLPSQPAIEILSTSTINQFVPQSTVNVFKTLATSAIWCLVILHIWGMRTRFLTSY